MILDKLLAGACDQLAGLLAERLAQLPACDQDADGYSDEASERAQRELIGAVVARVLGETFDSPRTPDETRALLTGTLDALGEIA